MRVLATVLVALVALLHFWFMALEMFLWTEPIGLKTFGNTLEVAESSAVLAANQGLYNGFLAAGLLYGRFRPSPPIETFALVCVVIAGVYGGLTAKWSILLVQALPAALALAAVQVSRRAD